MLKSLKENKKTQMLKLGFRDENITENKSKNVKNH